MFHARACSCLIDIDSIGVFVPVLLFLCNYKFYGIQMDPIYALMANKITHAVHG
jgi:hypothetical protein